MTKKKIISGPAEVHLEGNRFTFKVAHGNRIKIGTTTPTITNFEGRTFKAPEGGEGVYVEGGEIVSLTEAEARSVVESSPHALIAKDKRSKELLRDCNVFVTGRGLMKLPKASRIPATFLEEGISKRRFDDRVGGRAGEELEHDDPHG